MKIKPIITWVAQLVAAGILLQTLFFKFTGHPDSVLIFSTLGVEPWGRIALGVVELGVAVLLLIPKYSFKAALASTALMLGAIAIHLTSIGIIFNNDGGALFSLAVVTLLASVAVLFLRRMNA